MTGEGERKEKKTNKKKKIVECFKILSFFSICIYFLKTIFSPAVKGQNCSFVDKSIKLGRVTNLYRTNIS